MKLDTRGRGRIGVLVPFTNTNLEPDMTLLRPNGVSIHFARMGGYDMDEVPDAAQMQGMGAASIDEPLALLAGARPDVVLYGCTSATLSHGVAFDRTLSQQIEQQTGAKTVTAAGALVQALGALGVSRIAYASPYTSDVNQQAIRFLGDAGFECASLAEVPEDLGNYGQGELTPDEVFDLGIKADSAKSQALVLSCTDMRSVEVITQLETATGKPVVTSNQAMMFAAMGHLGIPAGECDLGRLFRLGK